MFLSVDLKKGGKNGINKKADNLWNFSVLYCIAKESSCKEVVLDNLYRLPVINYLKIGASANIPITVSNVLNRMEENSFVAIKFHNKDKTYSSSPLFFLTKKGISRMEELWRLMFIPTNKYNLLEKFAKEVDEKIAELKNNI